jgi:hypothetical protein
MATGCSAGVRSAARSANEDRDESDNLGVLGSVVVIAAYYRSVPFLDVGEILDSDKASEKRHIVRA